MSLVIVEYRFTGNRAIIEKGLQVRQGRTLP
jgi:hypothetical protein